jgi:hypothetical protein
MRTPYCYLIGWPEHNKWYYGVRYAIGCHPDELWKTYFTSSRYVRKFTLENGNPSVISIRKIFKEHEIHEARIYEHCVLRRMKVVRDDKWLNKTDNISIVPLSGDLSPSKRAEVREKIAKGTIKNTPRGNNHPRRKNPEKWRNANTDEVNSLRREKAILSEKTFKKNEEKIQASCIHCRCSMALGNLFLWHGDNCDLNPLRISEEKVCPHCGVSGYRNMNQFHFENCKNNRENTDRSRFDAISKSNHDRIQSETHNFIGNSSPNRIRLCCVDCKKETTLPSFSSHNKCRGKLSEKQ